MTLRRFWLGLATVSGLARRGFFIPHRYAAAIPRRQPAYDSIAAIMAAQVPAFRDMLESIDKLAEPLLAMNGPAPQPRWDQDWFPRADGAAAYTLVRHLRPARIVEVGSGHSTRFLMRAVVDEDFSCAFTAIDPAPRAAIDALPLTLDRKPVQQAGVAPFAALKSGDVLFIDSSHILMPGPTSICCLTAFCRGYRRAYSSISTTSCCPTTIRKAGRGAGTTSNSPSRPCCKAALSRQSGRATSRRRA